MRKVLFIFICLLSVLAASSCHTKDAANTNTPNDGSDLVNIPASATGQANGKVPKMVFTDTNFNFGDIKEGDKVTHVFTYKNEGSGDLVITSASASCGCTKPSYSNTVKHVGDTGTISVTFDSKKKSGKVVKVITLQSNCQPPYKYLTINANIQPSNN